SPGGPPSATGVRERPKSTAATNTAAEPTPAPAGAAEPTPAPASDDEAEAGAEGRDRTDGPAAKAQAATGAAAGAVVEKAGAAVENAEAAVEKGRAAVAAIDVERVAELWPAVVAHVRDSGAEMLSTLFDGARPLAVESERSVLRIGFPSSAKFNKRKAEAQANVERITESVKAVIGERLRPVYELIETEDEPVPAPGSGATAMAEEEIVELLKAKFDAREVEDGGRGEETA
ncbi:MAG: hypothetical protein ACRDKH_04890, partial [Solirubrobacterales bacterium]